MTIICYPNCSTCKKAVTFLQSKGLEFEYRNIKEDTPSIEELKMFHSRSTVELRKFFNTSGQYYRELQLKDKLPQMSEDEMYALLSSNGMLIKRPILIHEQKVLLGFKQKEWEELFK